MIAYFDTSAIIPLLIDDPLSDLAYRLWHQASWAASARVSYVEARRFGTRLPDRSYLT
ncbi:MAG: hypothetical protein OXD34_14855 [bacterium]|nr:hypothetical protein [bacterium]